MPIYKIIIPAIAMLMLGRGFQLLVNKKMQWREFVCWIMFWGAFGIIGMFPQIIEIGARFTGIQDSVKALFALIIMLMFYVILRLILAVESLERDITQLVRYNALEKFKNK